MMSQELTTRQDVEVSAGPALGHLRDPIITMKEVDKVALEFQRRQDLNKLYKTIGDSKHLLVEGWQMLGHMCGIASGVTGSRYIEVGDAHGWEATAEAHNAVSGAPLSSADAMCLDDEERWSARPKYDYVDGKRTQVGILSVPQQQLRSMAQTRAQSKVLSNLLKFVARMAGFAGTPAEEMTGHEYERNGVGDRTVTQPGRKSDGAKPAGNVISDAQSKRFYAICKSHKMEDDAITRYCQSWGFERGTDITRDKYEAMCALQPPPASQEKGDLQNP